MHLAIGKQKRLDKAWLVGGEQILLILVNQGKCFWVPSNILHNVRKYKLEVECWTLVCKNMLETWDDPLSLRHYLPSLVAAEYRQVIFRNDPSTKDSYSAIIRTLLSRKLLNDIWEAKNFESKYERAKVICEASGISIYSFPTVINQESCPIQDNSLYRVLSLAWKITTHLAIATVHAAPQRRRFGQNSFNSTQLVTTFDFK